MIKYLIVAMVGLGIGYTYGYINGDAGDDSLIDSSLRAVGVQHALAGLRGAADQIDKEERHRQIVIDSIKQARADSISSLIHH